jgi:hypothetical protein
MLKKKRRRIPAKRAFLSRTKIRKNEYGQLPKKRERDAQNVAPV